MTELQKLSLKKLRKLHLPLFVLDRKSKRQAFVILDEATFRGLSPAVPDLPQPASSPAAMEYDFRGKGLLWDRPDLSNEAFAKILADPNHPDYRWAASRILERLPSEEVLRLFSLEQISTWLNRAPLREAFRKPWEHALEYFRQKTLRGR